MIVMIIFKSMKCLKWDSLIFCECGYTFFILSSGLGLRFIKGSTIPQPFGYVFSMI